MSELEEKQQREDAPHYVSNVRLLQEYIDWFSNIRLAEEEGIEEPPIPEFIVDSMMRIANRLRYRPNFINYSYGDEMVADALMDCIKYAKKFNPDKILNKITFRDSSGHFKAKDIIQGETSKYTGRVKHVSQNKLSLEMNQNVDFSIGEKIFVHNDPSRSAIVDSIISHTANNPFAYITTICFQAFLRRIDQEKRQMYVKSQIVSELPIHDLIEVGDNEDDAPYINSYIEFLREAGYNEAHTPMSIRRARKLEDITDNGPLDEFVDE